MEELKIGDRIPAFSLPATGDKTVAAKDHAGRNLVLFFYPRDDTSGCTKEAVGFSEALAEFEASNTTVLGVSKDSIASHEKFAAKHGLTVPLLSDENGNLCELVGCWSEKKMYGRSFMGIVRTTVLADASGTVRQIFQNPGTDWVEGVYKFPLPDDAAVDQLVMKVGERVIEGEIQEKAEARKAYTKAVESGKAGTVLAAALLGVLFIYVVGFLPVAAMHSYAHDTRHSVTAPCH